MAGLPLWLLKLLKCLHAHICTLLIHAYCWYSTLLGPCAHPLPHSAGFADPERVAVIGGSHGGFLTGHLVGQQPHRFQCAVLRNPVCDLSVMIHGG